MARSLAHRGPDDEGAWADPASGIALGHRRLAILDLSPAGAQPMVSASGRFVIAFNGEVYNWRALREALEREKSCQWRGHSDTEILLECIEAWGIRRALQETCGMFAFALWDRHERRLLLARDRVGEKPLYYGWCGKVFLFGSELRALRAHPDWNAAIDRDAVNALVQFSYVPAPHSIFRGIHKLSPGHWLELSWDADADSAPVIRQYWSVQDAVQARGSMPFSGGPEQAVDALDTTLREVIGEQIVADVPVGAFLSGGIDSSVVVALMQRISPTPVRTFTIGYGEAEFNEADYAREVACHLGTRHTELIVSPQEALETLTSLDRIYDEPHADSSQLPTYMVCRLARGEVTVCLSGDGGDELFAGYNHYEYALRIWKSARLLPSGVRRVVQPCLHGMPGVVRRAFASALGVTEDKLLKAASMVTAGSLLDLYRSLSMRWAGVHDIVPGASPTRWLMDAAREEGIGDACERLMLQDFLTYMPDSILTKVDRAAMAVSLETRLPLLDRRVVELAWRMPMSFKLRDGKRKWILRRLLQRYVPAQLFEREKRGFGFPLAAWLRGPLREWAEALLDESRLRRSGLLRVEPVRARWAEHLSGRRDWSTSLWNVLMLEQWLESIQRSRIVRVDDSRQFGTA